MSNLSRRRPQIGDVVEISIPTGLAYALYTHEHKKPPGYGSLLRVFAGIYNERPLDFSALIQKQPLFTTFFPLRYELKQKNSICRIVGHEELPSWAIPFPVFRNGLPDREGIIHEWWLWDGEKEWRVGPLTPQEVRSYPGLGVTNDTALIQMIQNGWTSWHPQGRA